jgi:uncharacterized membrane protein YeaQ/YmgE (transglycosylase-associated protein family)
MLYIVIWVVCGFVAAAIAQNKGNAGFGAFLAGILLGPIGVIIAAVMPANPAGQAQRQLASGAMKKCPQCAELVQPDAKICRYCQYQFPEPPPLAPGEIRKVMQPGGSARCSGCGKGVHPSAMSCQQCKRLFVD